ncbi:MAG: MBL fold metallo-hydrolase [candidate division WOR-3 bacterium]
MNTSHVIAAGSKLKAELVAFDSFGVKGMCTCIHTPEITVVTDPGVSAQTEQFPLPAEVREKLREQYEYKVKSRCAEAEAIVISHYHLDHFFDLRDPAIYGGKIIFLKSFDDQPAAQQETARRFLKTIDGLPREIVIADGRRFQFGKTEIGFSPPVWHGAAEAEPGKVIMTEVCRGRNRILISSDVAGPVDVETADLIASIKPGVLIIDGYPTMLHSYPATSIPFVISLVNIIYLLLLPSVEVLVLDHHPARDYRYPALLLPLYQIARKMKKQLGTAAEVSGMKSAVLNALENYGTTRWHRWQPLTIEMFARLLDEALNSGNIRPAWLRQRLGIESGTVQDRLRQLST